jgi:hypothetical protein
MSKSVVDKVERQGRSVFERVVHAAAPYSPPWMLTLGALPVGNELHMHFGASPWTSVGMTLADVVLTGVTWEAGSKRSLKTRVHSTVSTALASGWLTAAAITGLTHPELSLWALGGGTLAASWNIRRVLRNSGRDEDGGDGGLWEKVKLAGVKHRNVKVEPNKVSVKLQLPGGQISAEDVQRNRTRIAGALSVPANGVRLAEDPDHADQMEMTVVPEDTLRKGFEYAGPSAAGTSMVEPLVIGYYEDTLDAMIYAAADPHTGRNLGHYMLMGTTGSGKSEAGRSILAEIATRRECSVWAIDVVKREQAIGPARGLFDWFATTRTQAEAMLGCLPGVISARTDYLASRGLDNWVPGCGLNFLVVWIEEAPSIIRDSDAFTDLVATARSAGVWFVISLQRASHTSLPTDARSNIPGSICFGTRDLTDAGFALPEEVIEAGADPSKWGNRRPGYAYAVGPGISESRFATPLRFPRFPADLLTQVIDAYAHLRDDMDPVTAMAGGAAYRDRTPGIVAKPAAQQSAAPADAIPQPEPQDAIPAGWQPPLPVDQPQPAPAGDTGMRVQPTSKPDVLAEMLAALPEDIREQLPTLELPNSPEPEEFRRALAALDQELPPIEFEDDDEDEPRSKPSREEALAAVKRHLVELAADPDREFVAAPDFAELLTDIDHSRTWMVDTFKYLVRLQVLAETESAGKFRIMRQNLDRELAGAF